MRKKIVVFGGSGFLGRYFCGEILQANSNINLINYDLKKINCSNE